MKCKGVGRLGYRLHYATVILGIGDSKVLTCREKITKTEEEGGREWQPMHGEIMIQDQRAKAAITWAMMGRVKHGFILMDGWLVNKTREIIKR